MSICRSKSAVVSRKRPEKTNSEAKALMRNRMEREKLDLSIRKLQRELTTVENKRKNTIYSIEDELKIFRISTGHNPISIELLKEIESEPVPLPRPKTTPNAFGLRSSSSVKLARRAKTNLPQVDKPVQKVARGISTSESEGQDTNASISSPSPVPKVRPDSPASRQANRPKTAHVYIPARLEPIQDFYKAKTGKNRKPAQPAEDPVKKQARIDHLKQLDPVFAKRMKKVELFKQVGKAPIFDDYVATVDCSCFGSKTITDPKIIDKECRCNNVSKQIRRQINKLPRVVIEHQKKKLVQEAIQAHAKRGVTQLANHNLNNRISELIDNISLILSEKA